MAANVLARPMFPARHRKIRQARTTVAAVKINTNDIDGSTALLVDGEPYKVNEKVFHKPGKGQAVVRTKLKNLLTSNVRDVTFKANDKVELADVYNSQMQYTYEAGQDCYFMDLETFDEVAIPKGDWAKFLKEGMTVDVLTWNGKVIGVEPPTTVQLQVAEAEPGLKSGRENPGTKKATLETGAVVDVPLFIDPGETVKVDTRQGQYISKA